MAKAVVARMEKRIEADEAIVQQVAESRGSLAECELEFVFAEDLFESLDKKILELENLNFEADQLIEKLPAVDLESLSAKRFERNLLKPPTPPANILSVLAPLLPVCSKVSRPQPIESSEKIAMWQERQEIAEKNGEGDDKAIKLCLQYIDGHKPLPYSAQRVSAKSAKIFA